MKTAIPLILATLAALCFAFGQSVQTISQSPQTFIDNADRVLLLKGRVAGDMKSWLIVEAHNGKEWRDNGYDPSYTRVLTDYKPLFRKLPSGQWEIEFVSEIAENLP